MVTTLSLSLFVSHSNTNIQKVPSRKRSSRLPLIIAEPSYKQSTHSNTTTTTSASLRARRQRVRAKFMHLDPHNNTIMAPVTQPDTRSHIMLLPPELRLMIFSYSFAGEKCLIAAEGEPPLLQVSKQLRAEAREAFCEEAELIICIGSNVDDRAKLRKQPGHVFDLDHIQQLRKTTGLIDVDHLSNQFLKTLSPNTIFRHVKFQVYTQTGIERTRRVVREPGIPGGGYQLYSTLHNRKSMMLASLSFSYINGKLRLNIERGESHPAIYKPKPTMRGPPPRHFNASDISAAMQAAISRVEQTFGSDSFKGFTIKDVKGIAAAFRYLTPRGRLQDLVLGVIDKGEI